MVRLGIWFTTLYVVVWLVILFILGVAYADRPLANRTDRFAEYLWGNYLALSIIFIILTIMLPILLTWVFIEEFRGADKNRIMEYVIKPTGNGTYVVTPVTKSMDATAISDTITKAVSITNDAITDSGDAFASQLSPLA